MADGVNIDWSIGAKQPDYVGDYANAFQVGRKMAQQAGDEARPANAFAPAAADPDVAGPDAAARIAALTPEQRAAADRQAETLGAVGQGLAGFPYAERGAILAHMAPHLAAQGVSPQMLAGFDPTDANLAHSLAEVARLRAMIAEIRPQPGPRP